MKVTISNTSQGDYVTQSDPNIVHDLLQSAQWWLSTGIWKNGSWTNLAQFNLAVWAAHTPQKRMNAWGSTPYFYQRPALS